MSGLCRWCMPGILACPPAQERRCSSTSPALTLWLCANSWTLPRPVPELPRSALLPQPTSSSCRGPGYDPLWRETFLFFVSITLQLCWLVLSSCVRHLLLRGMKLVVGVDVRPHGISVTQAACRAAVRCSAAQCCLLSLHKRARPDHVFRNAICSYAFLAFC